MSKKEYTNGEVTVVWKPGICIHSAICVKGLPGVFKPDEKPWIKMEGSDTGAIVDQVKKCPSGALSFFMNDSEDQAVAAGHDKDTLIEIMENGPMLVHGKLHVTHPNGDVEEKEKTTAFCRCGHSANKPYCDGAHRKSDFKG